ncbi:DUF4391 domain-containing protein [Novosphingobium sp. YAF33]|uniref:DUF4391 domain-containing protein n=1 Tax=Novosphingobium sp. YAF33 TaxID=3233082 RepID=UPI003F9E6C00
MTLYAWPARTVFGRAIPKSRIYSAAQLARTMQAKFVEQVERIEWTHVLRADRMNLKPSPDVEEIAVIAINLHQSDVDLAVLAAIEKAIPRPLILELRHGGRARMAVAWKRPSQAEAGKWVTAPHAFTAWQAGDMPREALPTALDMATFYARLLDPLLPPKQSPEEPIAARVARAEEAVQLEREITRLEAGLMREKQFNRKVELNAELRAAKSRHAALGKN